MLEFVILIGIISALIFTLISVGMAETTETTSKGSSYKVPLSEYGERAENWFDTYGFSFDASKSSDGQHEKSINYGTKANPANQTSLFNIGMEILSPYVGDLGEEKIKYIKGDKGDKGDPGDDTGGGGGGGGDDDTPITPTYPPTIPPLQQPPINIHNHGGRGYGGGGGGGGSGIGSEGSDSNQAAVLNAIYALAASYQEKGEDVPSYLSDSINYIKSGAGGLDGGNGDTYIIMNNNGQVGCSGSGNTNNVASPHQDNIGLPGQSSETNSNTPSRYIGDVSGANISNLGSGVPSESLTLGSIIKKNSEKKP